jgi:hypothetical protein
MMKVLLFVVLFVLWNRISSEVICDNCGVPKLIVNKCPTPLPNPDEDWSKLNISSIPHFILSDGSKNANQTTVVHLCSTLASLYVKFDCTDNNIYNAFDKCNEDLYKYDAVELFLASTSNGLQTPTKYIELEVSPTNALFAGNLSSFRIYLVISAYISRFLIVI